MAAALRGIFPIIYTPFTASGDFDEEDLRSLIDHHISSGAHGLAGCGYASESHKMTVQERIWLADVVMDQARGRVPVIIGTSAENTRTAVELSKHAQQAGARAVFLTPPTFGPLEARSIRAHFRAVAEAIDIPIMIQHNLIPVSVQLMVELATELANIRYVKEEAPEIGGHTITEILERSDGRLQVFSGGAYLLDELARGVVGAIPGSVAVADLSRAFDLYSQGDVAGARQAFNRVVPLLYTQRQAYLAWTKEVLRRQGVIRNAHVREPAGHGLDEHDHRELTAILDLLGPPYAHGGSDA